MEFFYSPFFWCFVLRLAPSLNMQKKKTSAISPFGLHNKRRCFIIYIKRAILLYINKKQRRSLWRPNGLMALVFFFYIFKDGASLSTKHQKKMNKKNPLICKLRSKSAFFVKIRRRSLWRPNRLMALVFFFYIFKDGASLSTKHQKKVE